MFIDCTRAERPGPRPLTAGVLTLGLLVSSLAGAQPPTPEGPPAPERPPVEEEATAPGVMPEGEEPQAAAEIPVLTEDELELREEIEDEYDVVPVRLGLVLRPHDPSDIASIELREDSLAVDGELVTLGELAERVDEEEVVTLAEMEPAERARLFASRYRIAEEDEEDLVTVSERERARRLERRIRRKLTDRNITSDAKVALGSTVTVNEDEVARDVVAIGGALYVEGEVLGDAVAVGGPVHVYGKVTGDVVSIGGRIFLDEDSEVLGSVVSVGQTIDREPGARVLGDVSEVSFSPQFYFDFWELFSDHEHERWWTPFRGFGEVVDFVGELMGMVLLILLTSLVLLLFRKPVEDVAERVASEPWKAGFVGLALEILSIPVLFIVTILLLVSIIGIPLIVLIPFAVLAFLLVGLLGYTSVAKRLGEVMNERFGWKQDSPYLILLTGVVLLQAWSVLAELLDWGGGPLWLFALMFAFFGFLANFTAFTVGLGGAFLLRFGGNGATAGTLPPPPVPPGDAPTGERALAKGPTTGEGVEKDDPESSGDGPDEEERSDPTT